MRNRLLALGLVVALLLTATGCDLLGDDENDSKQQEGGWVAMTAVYAKTDSGGTPIQRIVLADFDDPSNYKVITQNDHASIQPFFSPNKTDLLFGDRSTGAIGAPKIIRYDLQTEQKHYLKSSWGENPPPLPASIGQIVWGQMGADFYFTNPPQPYSYKYDVLYYRFEDNHYERIHDSGDETATYPIGLKGADTLIVFSNKEATPGCPSGCRFDPLYFMDLQGNYLDHINNPHLELINRDGVNKKVSYSLAWNDKLKRFATAYHDSTFSGYKIAVTNIDGSHYREYTSGKYIDDHPRWGPNGKYILFDRRSIEDHSFTGYRAMVLDLKTGEVREFVKPEVIDGAVALRFPDY